MPVCGEDWEAGRNWGEEGGAKDITLRGIFFLRRDPPSNKRKLFFRQENDPILKHVELLTPKKAFLKQI